MDKHDYERIQNESKIDQTKSTFPNVNSEMLFCGNSFMHSSHIDEEKDIRNQIKNPEIQLKRILESKMSNPIEHLNSNKDSYVSSSRSSSIQSVSNNIKAIADTKKVSPINSPVLNPNKPKKKSLKDPNDIRNRKSMRVLFEGDRKKSIVHQIVHNKNFDEMRREQRRKSSIFSIIMAQEKRSRTMDLNPTIISGMIADSQKGTDYEKCNRYLKIYDTILALLVIGNIISLVIDNNLYLEKTDIYMQEHMKENNITIISLELLEHMSTRKISTIENILRSLNLIFIIFIEIFIVLHYQIRIDLLKIDKRLSEFDNIFTSGLLKYMLIELFVCGIFYPPLLNQVTTGTMLGQIYAYNYNALVSIFGLIKMYLALRAYSYYSRWTTDIAKSICNKYNVKMGLHLTIKSELKKRPLVAITIMMVFSLGICSYCMRTFEYNVYQENSDSSIYNVKGTGSSEDLSTIANCMWLIIVTMTTVGYGDFYPKSHLGRFVGVISCIIGMLLVSLIVVSLTSILDFSSEEKKAYSVIKKLHAEDNVYCKATEVIKSVLLIRKAIRKRKEMGRAYLTERFILFTQLKRKINNFKNDYRYANSYALPIDEMLKKLEKHLKEDIKRLDNCINKMGGINDEIEDINNEQEVFDERIRNVIKMQEDVSSYLINLNNERFKKNLMKFREKKSLSKGPFLSPNINYDDFSDDNDIKHLMKKNTFNQ